MNWIWLLFTPHTTEFHGYHTLFDKSCYIVTSTCVVFLHTYIFYEFNEMKTEVYLLFEENSKPENMDQKSF